MQQRHPPKTGVLLIRITLRATLSPRPVTHCQNLNYSRPCGGTVPPSPAVPAGTAAASCHPRSPGYQMPWKVPSSLPPPSPPPRCRPWKRGTVSSADREVREACACWMPLGGEGETAKMRPRHRLLLTLLPPPRNNTASMTTRRN